MLITATQLATGLQCDWRSAMCVLTLLADRGLAQRVGFVRSTRGRAQIQWETPNALVLDLVSASIIPMEQS